MKLKKKITIRQIADRWENREVGPGMGLRNKKGGAKGGNHPDRPPPTVGGGGTTMIP